MASAHYEISSPVPPDVVWEFCERPANWVDLIPGYASHEALDDSRSVWNVRVDLGPFSRMVTAEVTVTEVVKWERVKFDIQGLESTSFAGGGEVRAVPAADDLSIVIDISMTPKGPAGPVVDAIAGPVLPRVTEAFANALIRKIALAAAERAVGLDPGVG